MEAAFAEAFNARDADALHALLAPDATTELVGSGFPEEQGPDAIRAGSITHLLEDGALVATSVAVEGTPYVAFHDGAGQLDSLAALQHAGGAIGRLRYHTRWHDAAFVERASEVLGATTPGQSPDDPDPQ